MLQVSKQSHIHRLHFIFTSPMLSRYRYLTSKLPALEVEFFFRISTEVNFLVNKLVPLFI